MITQEETHNFSTEMNASCSVRMRQLCVLALPYTCAFALDIIIQMVSLSYTGSLSSSVYLSGLGLAISIVNVFGLSLLYGFAFGYDTLGSQAIGALNYVKAGKIFNKAKIILLVVSFCLFPIFLFAGNFLTLLSISDGIADSVNLYMRIVYLGVILKPQTMLIRIHMKAQRVTWPTLVAQLISLILHFGWLELFLKYFEFGLAGVCVATLIAFSTEFFIDYIFLHSIASIKKESLQPFSRQDFKGWKDFMNIGFPTMLTIFLEWASYEIMNIAVTYLGAESLAAQAILSNLLAFLYLIAAGFGNTLTSLVGNSVGQGDSKLAQKFYKQGTTLTIIVSSSQSALFYVFSPYIFQIFTRDPQILTLCNAAALYLAIESVFDQLQCILASVLRGLSIVKSVFVAMLFMQWAVYLPLQIGVAIITLQWMPAIWIVQGAILFVLALIYFFFLFKADWEKIAMETHLTMQKKNSSTEPLIQVEQ